MEKLLNKYSFILVAALLLVFETAVILKGRWAGDFWEHSAVVHELSKHLLHPTNPIINSDLPHAFFSPYSVLVAVFSKIMSVNSIDSLTYFAFINLLLLLFSIYLFCKTIFKENVNIIATLSLIFILLFWGASPFLWSGFFHFFVLHKVLPYPSTFAFALSLIALAVLAKDELSNRKIALLAFLYAVILITHPPTAIFLSVGILSLSYCLNLKMGKSLIIIAAGSLLSLLWPYFNIINLIMDNNEDFANDSKRLYIGLFDSIHHYWPALLCVPAFLFLKKDRTILFFVVTIILLKVMYSVGFAFHFYAVSRVISYIMTLCYFLMAYLLVMLFKEKHVFAKPYALIISLAFIASLFFNSEPLKETFALLNNQNVKEYKKYEFLGRTVRESDVILSDEYNNAFIPSFNGKVLASHTPLYWLPDHHQRREAVKTFFDSKTTDEARMKILESYKPDYILMDRLRSKLSPATFNLLKEKSENTIQNNQFYIMKLNKQSLSLR